MLGLVLPALTSGKAWPLLSWSDSVPGGWIRGGSNVWLSLPIDGRGGLAGRERTCPTSRPVQIHRRRARAPGGFFQERNGHVNLSSFSLLCLLVVSEMRFPGD